MWEGGPGDANKRFGFGCKARPARYFQGSEPLAKAPFCAGKDRWQLAPVDPNCHRSLRRFALSEAHAAPTYREPPVLVGGAYLDIAQDRFE